MGVSEKSELFLPISHYVPVFSLLPSWLLTHVLIPLQISEAGEMAETILRSPSELRKLLSGASCFLQHPKHRCIFQS